MKKKLLTGLAAGLFFVASFGIAQATTINFDDTEALVANGQSITTEWNSYGLDVHNAYWYTDSRDTFDTMGLSMHGANPARIDFTDGPVSNLFVDWWTITSKIYIDTYDVNDTVLTSTVLGGPNQLGTVSLGSDISYLTWHDTGGYVQISTLNFDAAPVPEPATMLLFGTGLVGLVGSRLRKKKK